MWWRFRYLYYRLFFSRLFKKVNLNIIHRHIKKNPDDPNWNRFTTELIQLITIPRLRAFEDEIEFLVVGLESVIYSSDKDLKKKWVRVLFQLLAMRLLRNDDSSVGRFSHLKNILLTLLITGEHGQKNFQSLLDKKISLEYLVEVVKELEDTILTQENLQLLIHAGADNGKYLARAFRLLKNTTILTENRAQDNFKALTDACAEPNKIKHILTIFELLQGFTGIDFTQQDFERILNIDKNKIKHILTIFELLERFTGTDLTQQDFERILNIDENKIESIVGALTRLRNFSIELTTYENLNLLIDTDNPLDVAILMTANMNSRNFHEVLMKLDIIKNDDSLLERAEALKDNDPIITIICSIISRFAKALAFNLNIIKALLYQDPAQLKIIDGVNAEAIIAVKGDHATGDLNLQTLALAIKLHLAEKFASLPRDVRDEMPRALDAESSMRDDLIKAANQVYEKLKGDAETMSEESLNKIESEIILKLLDAILAEDDASPQIKGFVTKNKQKLADRSSDKLNEQAAKLLNSNTSVAQIAYRAYNPEAKVVEWANLLTSPPKEEQGSQISTNSDSRRVREFAVLIFGAINDTELEHEIKQELWNNFILYVAEVRRAHNDYTDGTDNPTCEPGAGPRLVQILNKHPAFQKESTPEDLPTTIFIKMGAIMARLINSEFDVCEGLDEDNDIINKKRFIWESLCLLIGLPSPLNRDANIDRIIEENEYDHPLIIFNDENIADLIRYYLEFLQCHSAAIYNEVIEHLRSKNIRVDNENAMQQVAFLIAKNLANLPGLDISILPKHQKEIQSGISSTKKAIPRPGQ